MQKEPDMESIANRIYRPVEVSSGRRLGVSAVLLAALLALLPAACGPDREPTETPLVAGGSQMPEQLPENPS